MEIKVGEYVRTKNGDIAKVTEIIERKKYAPQIYLDIDCNDEFNKLFVYDFDIIKHSENIRKVIEPGDFVNGTEVITVYGYDEDGNDRDEPGICETDEDYAYYNFLEDIEIYSVVTKEKFQRMEYRLR